MPDQGDNELENAEFVQLPLGLKKPAVVPALEANRAEPSNSHEKLPAPPASSSPVLDESSASQNGDGRGDVGQTVVGQAAAGRDSAGQASSDNEAAGQAVAGQAVAGQAAAGQAAAGQTVVGQYFTGQDSAGAQNSADSVASDQNKAINSPTAENAVGGDPLPGRKQPNYFSLLQEKDSGGIEILVQMANRGELDPKNIDIIDATDRFLKAIAAAPRENLRQSGKIIFHASVLLRMKAEALLITRIEDLDVGGDDFVDFDVDGSPIIFDSNDEAVGRQITLADLQRALVRRSKQKQSRSRRVTLEQLIESLREAEKLEKKRIEKKEREPKAVIQMDGYHAMEDMDDILDLAHDEDIEDVIARIEQLLIKKMEDMLRLSLGQLIKMLDGGGDWVDAFLAVLFLSNAGKINLEQEIFYGQLFLVKNNAVPTAQVLEATGTDGLTTTASMAELKALSAEFMSVDRKPDGVVLERAAGRSAADENVAQEYSGVSGTENAAFVVDGSATNGALAIGDVASRIAVDGLATGGAATGGSATAGAATGGVATGGAATGGSATGGAATAGAANDGAANAGRARGRANGQRAAENFAPAGRRAKRSGNSVSAPEEVSSSEDFDDGDNPVQLAAPLELDNTIGIGEAKRKRRPIAAKRPSGISKREKIGKNKKNENQLELEIMVPTGSNSESEAMNLSSLVPDSPEAEVYND